MPKKLSKDHLEKLKKGREKRNEDKGLVCALDEKIEVWADSRQYILRMNGFSEAYFSSLDLIMDELLEKKTRELAVKNQRNDLIGVKEAINEAQKWLEEMVKPLLSLHPNSHPSNKK